MTIGAMAAYLIWANPRSVVNCASASIGTREWSRRPPRSLVAVSLAVTGLVPHALVERVEVAATTFPHMA
jgi:hypothetical protein